MSTPLGPTNPPSLANTSAPSLQPQARSLVTPVINASNPGRLGAFIKEKGLELAVSSVLLPIAAATIAMCWNQSQQMAIALSKLESLENDLEKQDAKASDASKIVRDEMVDQINKLDLKMIDLKSSADLSINQSSQAMNSEIKKIRETLIEFIQKNGGEINDLKKLITTISRRSRDIGTILAPTENNLKNLDQDTANLLAQVDQQEAAVSYRIGEFYAKIGKSKAATIYFNEAVKFGSPEIAAMAVEKIKELADSEKQDDDVARSLNK